MKNSFLIKVVLLHACILLVCPSVWAGQLYDRVLKTGTIKAAYTEYYPFFMKDPNTKKFSGIAYDLLDLASKRLGLQLQLTEEVTWGTMIEGLKNNRYDTIASPVWANSQRARAADFSRPICFSPVCAFTKYGDKRIDSSLKGLAEGKFKISCTDGEMAEMIAKADYPKAPRLSLPQMAPLSDMLLNVSSGKADITFAEPVFVEQFSKKNPKSLQNITTAKPLRVFPNVYMFKAGEQDFKAMLNTALDEIANSGELEKIILKYEPYPKAFLRCSAPYQK